MSNNTPWIPQVTEVSDGQKVDAAVVNAVSDQLVQRDQYLYDALNSINNKSVLVALAQPLSTSEISAGVMTPGGQFAVYYYNNLSTGETGIRRAVAAFANEGLFYDPNNTSYTFGITQNITTSNLADVYMSGYLTLSSPLDDSTNGLLDFVSAGVRETYQVGPLFLSNKTPGLLTYNPSGLNVFVGYTPNVDTIILNPNISSFNQLFYSVQAQVLDRPAGTPVNTAGVWTITSPDLSRLGWVPVSALSGAYIIPPNAKFYYNIPSTFTTDGSSLTAFEEAQATLLQSLLPPDPTLQSILTINGVAQIQANTTDVPATEADYVINEYGLFWLQNDDPYQPWASNIGSGTWTPADWPTTVSSNTERPIINLLLTKFNPALSSVVVSSLTPYNDGTVNMLKLLNASDLTQSANTGNIVVQTTIPFDTTITQTSNVTAISNVTFDQSTGKITLSTAPLVSTLTTPVNSGLTLTNDGNGNYTITQSAVGSIIPLDSIEEIQATYEFIGLNSYLRLKYSTSVTSGLIGKVILPKDFPAGSPLKIYVHAFGFNNVSSTPLSAGFSFEYACSTCQNGAAPTNTKTANSTGSGALLNTTTSTTGSGSALFTFPAGYIAQTALLFQPTQFTIPAVNIGPDTVVNFRILQANPVSNPYNYDVGIITSYASLI